MAQSWTFDPSDLVVDMRKPAGYDDLLGQEKLAAKHDYLKEAFGARNFIFLGFENNHEGSTATRPIRVYTIYATFEVEHWPAQEVQKQKRRTEERIAKFRPHTKARSNKQRLENLDDEDALPVVHASNDEAHTGNATKRRRQDEGNWATRIEGNPNEALDHSEQSTQAFQEQPPRSEPSSNVAPSTARELGSHSKTERIAAGIAQARTALIRAAQKIELGLKADGRTFARNERPSPTGHLHERKITSVCVDRDNLEQEKGLMTEIRLPNSQMSVINQAAVLRANREKLILPLSSARAKSKTISHLPRSAETADRSPRYDTEFHHRFLKTTTEACSGVIYETQRHDICSELQAQKGYIRELLFTHKESCDLSKDARKAMVNGIIEQLLVGFEKTWSESHPEVTVLAMGNVLDRQIAYLTLDVAIKWGDVANMDQLELLMCITAVQREAMARQLVILRAITIILRQKAQSKRPVVARAQDLNTKMLASVYSPSKQVPSMSDGSFKPAVQPRTLVVDEVTGLASVMQASDLRKDIDDASSLSPEKKNLKRKQGAETSTSCKRPKTINAQEDDTRGASREQFMALQYSAQDTSLYCGSHKSQNDFENLFDQEGAETEPYGTIAPAKLIRSVSILPSTAFTSEPIANTPAPDKCGFMDVIDVFKAHGYNIVSEEERTENLMRHRQANRVRLEEQNRL